MSVSYTVDEAARVVYLTILGDPSFGEWRDTLLKVFSDPSYERGFNFISDRREAAVPSLEFAKEAARFRGEHARELGRCRWGWVVADPASYGMARMTATLADIDVVDVEIFYDMEQARRWVTGAAKWATP